MYKARDIAEQYLQDGDGEAVKESVGKLTNDKDEYNKIICLVRYYVRDPIRIKWSKQFEKTSGR